MDWYLDGEAPEAGESLRALRSEVRDYLLRHCAKGSALDDAELVFAEVVGNALRHARGPIWVSLVWRADCPTLTVRDLGPGFDPAWLNAAAAIPAGLLDPPVGAPGAPGAPGALGAAGPGGPGGTWELDPDAVESVPESGRGFFLITHLAPRLAARARSGEGMELSATLPVTRPAVTSPDPVRRARGALPDLTEAQPQGAFDRETFLRALVVQLAQAVEFLHGPDAADAAVAQVGIDVGGQMEAEYRVAERVVGAMTPEQLAHCYVRLKHAIDGGFYVIEADAHQIVLGNTRCPFGEAVRLAPALCQMTSSVFGGIAARNHAEGSSVLLEERIAVGDPGCRVVVYLSPPGPEVREHVHRYSPPA